MIPWQRQKHCSKGAGWFAEGFEGKADTNAEVVMILRRCYRLRGREAMDGDEWTKTDVATGTR